MQKTLTKKIFQPEHYHTRLWWMEVIRGAVNIAFGIILISHIGFTIRFLIYALGVYLLIDGILDIYKVATGRSDIRHKFTNYLAGMLSIVLGLISFVSPIATGFFIVAVIAVRIISRGVRVLIDARRSQHKYEGLTWFFGILLMLFGLAVFLSQSFRSFALVLIVIFIVVYTFCDGLYLLVRGLLLRFAPSLYTASIAEAPQRLLDLPANFPPTTRRAIVFVRHPGANGLGHIGWAFEWNNGWFNAGSVENKEGKPFAQPQEMGFWSAHTLDPIGVMQKQPVPYDEYKIFYVKQPCPKGAWMTVIWESREPYVILRHNCIDVAYDILRAYGATDLLDPAEELVPNDWYDALPGRSYVIEENPAIPLHLHKMSKRELATKEILLTIPPHVNGTPPPWRVNGWRAWQELNRTLDKMLIDVRTLYVSMSNLLKRRRLS
ncbi:MAG TPA: DUF308 domain-containing protein [Ktedonobacteraceae bacterium]